MATYDLTKICDGQGNEVFNELPTSHVFSTSDKTKDMDTILSELNTNIDGRDTSAAVDDIHNI